MFQALQMGAMALNMGTQAAATAKESVDASKKAKAPPPQANGVKPHEGGNTKPADFGGGGPERPAEKGKGKGMAVAETVATAAAPIPIAGDLMGAGMNIAKMIKGG